MIRALLILVVLAGCGANGAPIGEGKGCDLPDLSLEDMQSVHTEITQAVYDVLGVHNSVASRTSYGGTAPAQVRAQIARWKDQLA